MKLTDWETTLAGFVMGVIFYGANVGLKMPTTKQEWWSFAFAAAAAGLGYVAKGVFSGKGGQ